jgi:hypothetical protein
LPRRGNPFQSLVRELHAAAPVGCTVIESAELRDIQTGEIREVDLVIEANVEGYSVRISVECTASRRPADVTWVEEMIVKHQNLPTDRLVLVSAAGFSRQAATKARANRADVLALGEVAGVEWTKVVGKIEEVLLVALKARILLSAVTDDTDENRATSSRYSDP